MRGLVAAQRAALPTVVTGMNITRPAKSDAHESPLIPLRRPCTELAARLARFRRRGSARTLTGGPPRITIIAEGIAAGAITCAISDEIVAAMNRNKPEQQPWSDIVLPEPNI